ncbi:MAG: hypothetical protein HN633_14970 [Candidatus Marinimicrobia bacterium]|nr:hypothetical protein [Candidatus Neomarinimicrobiota bacterium]
MASCKWCKNSGMFVKVDYRGLCKSCAPKVSFELQQRARVIESSLKIVNDGKVFKTRWERCELVLDHARQLQRYEQMDISVSDPSPSTVIANLEEVKEEILAEQIELILKDSISKAKLAKTDSSTTAAINKGITKLENLSEIVGDEDSVFKAIDKLNSQSNKILYSYFIEKAKKFEFKEQYSKALDQYYEALYVLKTDDVDDPEQGAEIKELELKIQELKSR